MKYIELLLNRLSLDDFDRTRVHRMELAFMHESRYGQHALVWRADHDLTSYFSINNLETGEPGLIARLDRVTRM